MPHRLARHERLIVEGRADILDRLFRIMAMEAAGQDTGNAEEGLTACMGVLAIHHCMRETIAEGQRLQHRPAMP